MKSLLALATAVAALALAPAALAQGPADRGGPLVYVLVLDGLDGDRVDQGEAPFLSSLAAGEGDARGTLFRESRSVMVAETNPNHTAMATGDYANRSGIPGNAFAVYRRGTADDDGCPTGPVDETRPPHLTSGESATCLAAETFFQAAARQRGASAVTTAGIFGKPKLARLFSARRGSGYAADYLWTPCEGDSGDPPYCRDVPTNPVTGYAQDDSVVMDELLRSVREGVRADGASKRPNLTFVNFPQIDSAGHATGAGAVYDEAIGMADAQLRRFVDQQRQLGLWRRTVMIVLSDHSMDTTGQKTSLGQRFQQAGISGDDYEIVQNGSVDMVYLTNRAAPGRFELLRQMRVAATSSLLGSAGGSEIDEALYRLPNPADGGRTRTLAAVHPSWRVAGARTGDLFVTHKGGGAFSDPANPLPGNHGGPQTVDNYLAVMGGSPLIADRGAVGGAVAPRFDDTRLNPHQAENVDVAPTAMGLLQRRPPARSRGRFLEEAFILSRLPRGGAGLAGVKPAGSTTRGRIRLRVKPRRVRAGRRVTFRFRAMAPRDPAIAEPINCRSGVRPSGACARGAGARGAGSSTRLAPVGGAVVRFAGKRARTGRRGYARIRVRLRRAGLHRARATAPRLRRGTTRVRAIRRAGRRRSPSFTG